MLRILISCFFVFYLASLGAQVLMSDTLIEAPGPELKGSREMGLLPSVQSDWAGQDEQILMDGVPVRGMKRHKAVSLVFWILLLQLFLFASVKILHPAAYSDLLGDVLRYKLALQRYSHHDIDPLIIDVTLRISALLSITLLLSYSLNYFEGAPFSFELFIRYAGVLLLFYIFKKIIDRLLAYVFGIDFILGFLQFYTDQLIKFFGLLLYPVTVLLAFVSGSALLWLLYLAGGLFLLFLSIRFIRGIALTSSLIKHHFFHIILYICTLEIIPFLLIFKESVKFLKS